MTRSCAWVNGVPCYDAEPVPANEAPEFEADELTMLDGKSYLIDDLYHCSCCEEPHVSRCDLDHEGECEECARESEQARRDDEDLRSWYRSAVL